MITRSDTLKAIKEKVDSRTSGTIKLKKQFWCDFKEGVFVHVERRRITKLVKQGNSVMWMDDSYQLRNITVLDTKDLHKILWQLITDKEKKEIAYEHFISKMDYLVN